MDSKFDMYHKLRKLRIEYKKNPSKELEDYIEKLAEQLKQTVSSYKVFSRLNMITSYFTLKNIDSQRSEGKFDTYEDAKKYAEEKNIDLSDEDSPYFIDEIKESKIEPKKSPAKNPGLSKEDREELNKLRDEKSYWKSIQVKDSDHRKEALKNIGRINKTIKQKFGLNW